MTDKYDRGIKIIVRCTLFVIKKIINCSRLFIVISGWFLFISFNLQFVTQISVSNYIQWDELQI